VDEAAKKTVTAAKMIQTEESAKKTMDIVNDASSHIIEKASDEDVAGL